MAREARSESASENNRLFACFHKLAAGEDFIRCARRKEQRFKRCSYCTLLEGYGQFGRAAVLLGVFAEAGIVLQAQD